MNFHEFLNQFSITTIPETQKIGRSYFAQVNKELLNKKPIASGECLAHERGEKLIPSISLLQFIGTHAQHTTTLTKEGEWQFICGKNLREKHINTHTATSGKTLVAVLNQHKECIGYGIIIVSAERITLTNMYDIGDYLRREKN